MAQDPERVHGVDIIIAIGIAKDGGELVADVRAAGDAGGLHAGGVLKVPERIDGVDISVAIAISLGDG
jgi:hypothetical protein